MKSRIILILSSLSLGFYGSASGIVASSPTGLTVHNTSTDASIENIWERSAILAGGSGTYLGKYDGSYWVLTADHVGTTVGSTLSINAKNYTILEVDRILNEPDFPSPGSYRTYADVKLLKIAGDADLEALGNIYINQNPITDFQSTLLYAIGSGYAASIGGTNSGSRIKQWADFYYNSSNLKLAIDTQRSGVFFTERFDSVDATSFQATTYDSGGGIFAEINNQWYLVGIMNAVSLGGDGLINSGDTSYMLDLSAYADNFQLFTSAVPEPSFYGTVFSGLAVTYAALHRRVKL